MHMSKFSGYALRVLIIAAARGKHLTITQTAETIGIFCPHLKKIALKLTRAGYLRGDKGRSGGFLLSKPPEQIALGAVLRVTDANFRATACLQNDTSCHVVGRCRLPSFPNKAVGAVLAVFDGVTLANVALPMQAFRFLLNVAPGSVAGLPGNLQSA